MTTQQFNINLEQAEVMWRALWTELEEIGKGYSTRRFGAQDAFNEHLNAIALLRQLNTMFKFVNNKFFDEMIYEASLAEPLFVQLKKDN